MNKDGDLTGKDVLGLFRWSVLELSLSLRVCIFRRRDLAGVGVR